MFRPDRMAVAISAVLAVLWCGATRLEAEEVVFVSFQFGESSVAQRFGPALAATQDQMADWLIGELKAKYPYWNYQRAGAASEFPRLAASLKFSPPDWLIIIAIQSAAGQQPAPIQQVVWVNAAELERTGLPGRDDIPPSIKKKIGEQILAAQDEALFKALHKVPVVRDVRLANPSTPRAVLALDWARHWQLGLSEFKLHYRTAGGLATVTCTGVGSKLAYPAPPPASGLEVQLQQFELGGVSESANARLGDILSSQPIAVFLTRFEPLAASLLSPTGDAGIPSVAPPR
jgi:hypothetical protein